MQRPLELLDLAIVPVTQLLDLRLGLIRDRLAHRVERLLPIIPLRGLLFKQKGHPILSVLGFIEGLLEVLDLGLVLIDELLPHGINRSSAGINRCFATRRFGLLPPFLFFLEVTIILVDTHQLTGIYFLLPIPINVARETARLQMAGDGGSALASDPTGRGDRVSGAGQLPWVPALLRR